MTGHLDQMHNTKSAYREMSESFDRERAARIQLYKDWIADEQKSLEDARKCVAQAPEQIAKLQAVLASLERLEMVPLEEMVREVKP